jgi:hypothetical protein
MKKKEEKKKSAAVGITDRVTRKPEVNFPIADYAPIILG